MTRVSVIIPNRKRRDSLRRTVMALRHQTHRDFELIIASDAPEIATLGLPDAERIKFTHFTAANISACRMAGVALSDAPIVAFIDDDAVPEPTWLAQILTAFEDPKIGAAGGHVLGRNGVSTQWGDVYAAPTGEDCDSQIPGAVRKPSGTNCAFRSSALRAIGGFDHAYRYYLDETDVMHRLAGAGWDIAHVPGAIVHHGYLGNDHRNDNRQPLSWYEIGASKAYFCGQHLPPEHATAELATYLAKKTSDIQRLPERFPIPIADMQQMIADLTQGLENGAKRHPALGWPDTPAPPYQAFGTNPAPAPLVLYARIWNRRRILAQAKSQAHSARITVIDLAPNASPMRVAFTDDGYWLHSGGIWGRTERAGPHFQPRRIRTAFAREKARISAQRAL